MDKIFRQEQCQFMKEIKLFPIFAVMMLLNGCAVWTGGIPDAYKNVEQYPIIASVHGVKTVTYSNDLQKIVVSYMPTNEITLNTNTIHGWLIQIEPTNKPLIGEEFYILPKAARWGADAGIISMNRTTSRKDIILPKGTKYISDNWGMYPDDPVGEYKIEVFLGHRLAANFEFRVKSPNEKP